MGGKRERAKERERERGERRFYVGGREGGGQEEVEGKKEERQGKEEAY